MTSGADVLADCCVGVPGNPTLILPLMRGRSQTVYPPSVRVVVRQM
jgi:hypothetical protein